MRLNDKEIILVDKNEYIGFKVTPKTKTAFLEALAIDGKYNTMTDCLIDFIRIYTEKIKGGVDGGKPAGN